MNFKIGFLCMLLCSELSGSNRIDIYLSFNECVNCYANLGSLEAIAGYEKNMLIYREDSLLSIEFLENYSLPETIHYNYLPGKAPDFSYCKVFINNQVTDSFALQQLSSRLKQLTSYLHPAGKTTSIKTFSLPKNTVLKNDRLDLSVRGNYLNAYDYILNKTILFSLDSSKDTLQKTLELKGPQFSPKLFLTLGRLDSVFYYRCFELLKKKGKAVAHMEGSFLSDSSLFLLLNFPWIHIDPQNGKDTLIDVSYFLYERNLTTGSKKLAYINDGPLKQSYHNRYSIDNTRPFFVDRISKKVNFSLLDYTRPDNDIRVLAEFIPGTNGYAFDQLNPIHIDKNYYTANMIDGYSMCSNLQFYFSIKFKLIIDCFTNTLISLNNFNLPDASFGLDILSEHNVLKLLVLHKNEIEIVSYNQKTKTATPGKRKTLPADCSVNSIKLYDTKTIVFLNQATTKLCQMSMAD